MSRFLRALIVLSVLAGLASWLPAQENSDRDLRPWFRRLGRLRVPGVFERSHQSIREAYRDIVKPVGPSVVRVLTDGSPAAYGTVVREDGWVITKESQLKGTITCQLFDGQRVPAEKVASDAATDLALLHLEVDESLPPIQWRQEPVQVGSWLAVVGLGQLPVAIGVVSNQPREIPKRIAYLGVMLADENEEPTVREVVDGSAAERAGMSPGDVVLQVEGKKVQRRAEVVAAIRGRRPGETLRITVRRMPKSDSTEDDAAEDRDRRRPPLDDEGDQPPSPTQKNKANAPVAKPADAKETPAEPEVLELKAVLGDLESQNPQSNLGGPLSDRRGGFQSALQHDAIVSPEDCGGPIVDLDGRVVGINIARAGRVENYALPTRVVQDVLHRLLPQASKTALDTAQREYDLFKTKLQATMKSMTQVQKALEAARRAGMSEQIDKLLSAEEEAKRRVAALERQFNQAALRLQALEQQSNVSAASR